MKKKKIALLGPGILVPFVYQLQLILLVLLLPATASSQCHPQTGLLQNSNYDLTVIADPSGSEAEVLFSLDGNQDGQDFIGLMGLSFELDFGEDFAPQATVALNFDSSWLASPQNYVLQAAIVEGNRIRVTLSDQACLPASGQGLLLSLQVDNGGTPFNWSSMRLADGGVLIEDIFPMKRAAAQAPAADHAESFSEVRHNIEQGWLEVVADPETVKQVKLYRLGAGSESRKLAKGTDRFRLETIGLSSGIYLLWIQFADGTQAVKKVFLP